MRSRIGHGRKATATQRAGRHNVRRALANTDRDLHARHRLHARFNAGSEPLTFELTQVSYLAEPRSIVVIGPLQQRGTDDAPP
jgi:hypothetical protein